MSTGSERALENIESAFADLNKATARGKINAKIFGRVLGNLPVTKMQILEKLAPKMGKSIAELADMQITKLPVDKVIASIKEATLAATGAGGLGEIAAASRVEKVSGAWNALKNTALNVFDEIANRIEGSDALIGFINDIETAFSSEGASEAIDSIASGVTWLFEGLRRAWPIALEFAAGLKSGFESAMPGIEAVASLFSTPTGGLEDGASGARAFGESIGAIAGEIANVVTWIAVFIDRSMQVWGMVSRLGEAGNELGGALVKGITAGISSGASAVYAKVASVAKGAIQAAKAAFIIRSPSRPFVEMGEMTDRGLIKGRRSTRPPSAWHLCGSCAWCRSGCSGRPLASPFGVVRCRCICAARRPHVVHFAARRRCNDSPTRRYRRPRR